MCVWPRNILVGPLFESACGIWPLFQSSTESRANSCISQFLIWKQFVVFPFPLQVAQFSNKSVDMSLRVASLDYLGTVAARLRKDAVTSMLNEDILDDIIGQVSPTVDT